VEVESLPTRSAPSSRVQGLLTFEGKNVDQREDQTSREEMLAQSIYLFVRRIHGVHRPILALLRQGELRMWTLH
jgi:hypothetical protein